MTIILGHATARASLIFISVAIAGAFILGLSGLAVAIIVCFLYTVAVDDYVGNWLVNKSRQER